MSITSRWIAEFDKQVLRGKHALLYGNVHDQSIYRGNYMTALDFQANYFLEKGFEIVAGYDPIEGVSFPTPEIKKKYDETLRKAIQGNQGNENGGLGVDFGSDNPGTQENLSQQQQPSNPRVAPIRRMPQAAANNITKLSMDEAFAGFRRLLAQKEVSSAVLVDLVDMLTSDPERYAQEERQALMQLKKCSLEATLIENGDLKGYRNTLVITAGDLNRVPQWLYRDNPFISIVQVARPTKEERKQYFLNFSAGFHSEETIVNNQELAEDFANLTEGFQSWDLEALRRTSHIDKIPVNKPSKLVDFFKFGLREDPWERLNHNSVKEAGATLSKRVIGQPRAIEAVTTMLTSARVGLGLQGGGKTGQPKGVFFFVGPTGVGKTELAKSLTEFVFSDESAFERFDMSEYKEEHAAEKLTGSPPGYVGYAEGGRLTNRMMERPHSILLFDEIEKAHPLVLDKFLQILEDGRLTDGKGQTAYFNQAAIIFTSNIGASELMKTKNGNAADITYDEIQKHFTERVRHWFVDEIKRAELLNRLGDNIIAFDILRPEYVRAIADKFLSQFAAAAMDKYQLSMTFDESVFQHVTEKMRENGNLLLGGRRIKTLLQDTVVNSFNRWFFENISDKVTQPNPVRIAINGSGNLEVTNV